jgi:hypothetical protein
LVEGSTSNYILGYEALLSSDYFASRDKLTCAADVPTVDVPEYLLAFPLGLRRLHDFGTLPSFSCTKM